MIRIPYEVMEKCSECGEEMESGFIDDCGACFECIETQEKEEQAQ